jgi:hypothetical protein
MADFEIILRTGWNAISLPLVPEDSRPEKVFEPVLSELKSVWTYKKDTWYVYTPGAGADTITEIKFGEGYDVNMNIPAGETRTLPLYGTLKDKLDPIHVQPKVDGTTGWYYIGAASKPVAIKDLIAISLDYGEISLWHVKEIAVYSFNAATAKYDILMNKEDMVIPGNGYELGTNVDTYLANPIGDITKVEVDSTLLPEGETLGWIVNTPAIIKAYFKNIGTATGIFHIWVTDEDGVTLCDLTTASVPADGVERYVSCPSFTPSVIETKTLRVYIEP